MIRSGYDVKLSSGLIAAGGTLGILIPPSIMLVVMGPVLQVPVTTLFAAAIVPGLLLALLFTSYAMVRCMINPSLGPPLPLSERPTSMREVWIEFFLGLVPPAALSRGLEARFGSRSYRGRRVLRCWVTASHRRL